MWRDDLVAGQESLPCLKGAFETVLPPATALPLLLMMLASFLVKPLLSGWLGIWVCVLDAGGLEPLKQRLRVLARCSWDGEE